MESASLARARSPTRRLRRARRGADLSSSSRRTRYSWSASGARRRDRVEAVQVSALRSARAEACGANAAGPASGIWSQLRSSRMRPTRPRRARGSPIRRAAAPARFVERRRGCRAAVRRRIPRHLAVGSTRRRASERVRRGERADRRRAGGRPVATCGRVASSVASRLRQELHVRRTQRPATARTHRPSASREVDQREELARCRDGRGAPRSRDAGLRDDRVEALLRRAAARCARRSPDHARRGSASGSATRRGPIARFAATTCSSLSINVDPLDAARNRLGMHRRRRARPDAIRAVSRPQERRSAPSQRRGRARPPQRRRAAMISDSGSPFAPQAHRRAGPASASSTIALRPTP